MGVHAVTLAPLPRHHLLPHQVLGGGGAVVRDGGGGAVAARLRGLQLPRHASADLLRHHLRRVQPRTRA